MADDVAGATRWDGESAGSSSREELDCAKTEQLARLMFSGSAAGLSNFLVILRRANDGLGPSVQGELSAGVRRR